MSDMSLITRFFARMQHLYGYRWAKLYGEAMEDGKPTLSAQQWLADLAPYSREVIAYGIQELELRREEFPPGVLEFKNILDGVPTVDEILDRENDYGPVCKLIRQRLDWHTLGGLDSRRMREMASERITLACTSLRRSGAMAEAIALIHQKIHRDAIANKAKAAEKIELKK